MQRLGFLGPEGTFSQQAALTYAQDLPAKLIALPTIREVLLSVQREELDLAVIPVENSFEGAVNITLDLLAWEVDLLIEGEIIMPVDQYLLVPQGISLPEIKRIYTHPQAAGQCRKFLETELPWAEVCLTYSTAEGARLAKQDVNAGAIAPIQAAEVFRLEIARRSVQDSEHNHTRFIAVSKKANTPSGCDKTSVVFSTEHKPGSLYRILDIFNLWDINLSKIESRPARGKLGSYIFFVDLDGHAEDSELSDALTMVKRKTTFYKYLGSYPKSQLK